MFKAYKNKFVKVSYWSYRNNNKRERFLYGAFLDLNETHVMIKGHKDGKLFTLKQEDIIEIVEEGEIK